VSEFIAQHPVLVASVIKVAVLMALLMTVLAYLSWFERKVVAHIQSRWGPYRAGPHGLLQPLADGVKFLFKEDPTPAGADKAVYFFAPFFSLALALCGIAVIPFGPYDITLFGLLEKPTHLGVADLNIGILFLFALTSLGVYGVALAGWASNSKYPLLGALRSSAQMVSYELAMTLSVVGVLLAAGSFSLTDIMRAQEGHIFSWFLFSLPFPQIVGFLIFFTAAVAETNRLPFDLAEAETELVAGFHTEYASFKFAMFFIGEYASMVTVSLLASLLFFGGWNSPFPQTPLFAWTHYLPTALLVAGGLYVIYDGIRYETTLGKIVLPVVGMGATGLGALCALDGARELVQGPFWFLSKAFVFLFVYVWLRGTLPRFRYDQLMRFGWKVLVPVSLANVVVTSFLMLFTE
jgi:NADH-quinone oxidoreductase subunit H